MFLFSEFLFIICDLVTISRLSLCLSPSLCQTIRYNAIKQIALGLRFFEPHAVFFHNLDATLPCFSPLFSGVKYVSLQLFYTLIMRDIPLLEFSHSNPNLKYNSLLNNLLTSFKLVSSWRLSFQFIFLAPLLVHPLH